MAGADDGTENRRRLLGRRRAPPRLTPAGYAAVASAILLVALALLAAYGRPAVGPGGLALVGPAGGPRGSTAILDAYAALHVVFGFLLRGLLQATSAHWPRGWLWIVVLASAAVWEMAENAPPVVDRFALNPVSGDYSGDSLANAIGDMAAVATGYGLAGVLPVAVTVPAALAIEAGITAAGLDGLAAAGWKLVAPPEG